VIVSPLGAMGWTGESVIKSVRPVESTRLKAPGDMEENMVSKMSKPGSSPPLLEMELSRHVLNNGSFMSNRFPPELSNEFPPEVGVKDDIGAVEVDDGMVLLKLPVMEDGI